MRRIFLIGLIGIGALAGCGGDESRSQADPSTATFASTRSPDRTAFHIFNKIFELKANSPFGLNSWCPNDFPNITGGGFQTAVDSSIKISSNTPIPFQGPFGGWSVAGFNNGPDARISVDAICTNL